MEEYHSIFSSQSSIGFVSKEMKFWRGRVKLLNTSLILSFFFELLFNFIIDRTDLHSKMWKLLCFKLGGLCPMSFNKLLDIFSS